MQTFLINANRFLNSALFTSFATIFGSPWINAVLAKFYLTKIFLRKYNPKNKSNT